ncbi:MAG TPA: hypothetical protein VI319_13655 [Burkholderiales bacterium]
MSLSFKAALARPRVVVGFSPAEVTLARIEGRLKPRLVAKRALGCDPAAAGEPWQGAAGALAALAAEVRDVRCDVTVVLSNHFVRYALVPASDTLDSPEEESAYARYCFSKVHGERARTWDVRLSGPDDGGLRVASAIDAALLEAIRACFPATGRPRLVSVQPYLMAAFNRSDAGKGKHSGWLLLVEPQRACLACIDAGRWTAVRNVKGDYELPARWAELLERERYVAGAPEGDVIVHAGAAPSPAETGPWRFRLLAAAAPEGYSARDDGRFAMALCAA